MAIKKYNPTSNGRRNMTGYDFSEITKSTPEKTLLESSKNNAGRNSQGKITVRHQGGGHKRAYRVIDFKRNKDNVEGVVHSIEYDPNRTANIALIHYVDGVKAYIIAPKGLTNGDKVISSERADIKPGNVIMIEKNQETENSEGKVLQNTFAKNIQEIMKENLIDNIYGDFALAKINSMIERLNGEEEQEENEEELLKEIHLISEPILRNKLLEMYDKKYNTSEFSIEKQLQKLNLNEEQRQKIREMIEENTRNT